MRTSVAAQTIDSDRRGNRGQLIILCVLAAVGLVVAVSVLGHGESILNELRIQQANVHHATERLGIAAPIAFTLAFAALMLLVWFPTWPCILVGGFLFGPPLGAACSLLGSTLGAVAVFILAKSGLAPRVPRSSPLMRKLDEGFRRDALEYVLMLRIMPVMPFGIIHVAAAIFDVPLRIFVVGTFIGMIPFTIIYALLGHDLDRIAASGAALDARTFLNPDVEWPLFGLAALALVPVVVRRFRGRPSAPKV